MIELARSGRASLWYVAQATALGRVGLKSVQLFSVQSANSEVHLNNPFSARKRRISSNRLRVYIFDPLSPWLCCLSSTTQEK